MFGQPAPGDDARAFGDLLRIHVIPDDAHNQAELERVGIPGRSFFLLRPDGYIGMCGALLETEELASYAKSRLGLLAAGKSVS